MTKEKLEKIKALGIIGCFVGNHLVKHHNFSVKEAGDFITPLSTHFLSMKKEKWVEMIKKSGFPKK